MLKIRYIATASACVAALLCAAACGDSIGVDVKIDETKISATIPDSLMVTIGHTDELYIPIPLYEGRPVTDADIKVSAKSRNERVVTARAVNDSTFAFTGESIGTAIVDIRYGTYSHPVHVDVVDEMITALRLSTDRADLWVGDTLGVTYEVDPASLIGHKLEIDIPGLEDNTFLYQAYSDAPGRIHLRAAAPGTTTLTFRVDTCKAIISASAREVLPTGISGGISGTWSLKAGDVDSSQFNVVPDNTTFPELDLVLTSWQPEDLYDIPITDADGKTVGTMKSNYDVERDAAGDPVITLGGQTVPYRDSLGNVISYSGASVKTRCVYTPKIEDYLIYDGHRLNNHKMTALKACSASFTTHVIRHPEISRSFNVKVTGEKHRYQ